MKIAYRRMSGSVGFSDQEPGFRGAWLEKRKALFMLLQQRGHDIEVVGRLSKASGGVNLPWQPPYDLLMVEFGGGNKIFNGRDLELTLKLAHEHHGPKVFLCDDPDLDFIWDELEIHFVGASGWFIWNNSLTAARLPKQPKDIPVYDYPFSWNVPERAPLAEYDRERLVYIGRPGGRSRPIKELVAAQVPFVAYAKPVEWAKFPQVKVLEPPTQAARGGFYARALGCLALADAKHKKLAWRTGRAFHALAAGCPAVCEEDHPGLEGFDRMSMRGPAVLRYMVLLQDLDTRRAQVARARMLVQDRDQAIAEATLLEFGL